MKSNVKSSDHKIHVWPYAIATAVILSIPLIAMQFTDEVQWGLFDFLIIGCLLFGAGFIYELISTKIRTARHKAVAAVVTILVVLYLWAELAVGIFTNWGS